MESINGEPHGFFGKVGVTESHQADGQLAPVGLARSGEALEGLRCLGGKGGEQGKDEGAGPSILPTFSRR